VNGAGHKKSITDKDVRMDLSRQKLTASLAAKGRKETDPPTPNVDRRTALAGLFSMGAAGAAHNAHAQTAGTVFAYTDKESYSPGDTVRLHASAQNYSQYPVDVQWSLRDATSQSTVVASGALRVEAMYPRVDSLDQRWPLAGQMTIPANLKSGVYLFTFTPSGSSSTWIVVRETSAKRAEILIVVPTFTVAAYNDFGGRSTYHFNSINAEPAQTVSMLRPNGPSMTGNWYPNMNALSTWMSSQYDCSFAADIDLHENPELLRNKKCIALIGHNEYYTHEMRRNLQRYLNNGGHVANLGGNSCWWLIDYDRINRTITHNKDEPVRWYWHRMGNSAKTQLGCAFENGGFNARKRPHLDATIYRADHWLFDSSLARNGQVFGRAQLMADYEVDGITVEWVQSPAGGQVPRARPGTGTPPSFEVLAFSDLTNVDWDKPGFPSNWTIGFYHTQWGGRFFNGGTIQWGHAFIPNSAGAIVASAPIHLTRNFFNSCVAGSMLYEHSAPYPTSSAAPRSSNLRRYLYVTAPAAPAGWSATSAALILPRSTEVGAVRLYRHITNNQIPNTRNRVILDSLSTEPVRAGWTLVGEVGFAFNAPRPKTRPVHVYFAVLPEGRVERLSVRQEAKAGETYGGIRFHVY